MRHRGTCRRAYTLTYLLTVAVAEGATYVLTHPHSRTHRSTRRRAYEYPLTLLTHRSSRRTGARRAWPTSGSPSAAARVAAALAARRAGSRRPVDGK